MNELLVELERHFRASSDLGRIVADTAMALESDCHAQNPEVGFGVVVLRWVRAEELV
jgi:hypothetical protein